MPNFADVVQADLQELKCEHAEPNGKGCDHDEVVGLMPDFTRKLYTLAQNYERKSAESAIEARYARLPEERERLTKKSVEYSVKSKAIMEIMWVSLREEFDCWVEGMGVRQGWKVVKTKHDDHPFAQLLGGILGQ